MADPTEALARMLFEWNTPTDPYFVIHGRTAEVSDGRDPYLPIVEALLADPVPLLAALAEAGVLTEVYSLARHDPQPDMSGRPRVQRAGESPDRNVMEEALSLRNSEGRWIERRYVTDWRPADA